MLRLLLICCLFLSPNTFSYDWRGERTILSCKAEDRLENSFELKLKLIDGSAFLEYSYEGDAKLIAMTQLSGVEFMGNDGQLLIFLELLPSGQYLFTIYDSKTFTVLEGHYLSCARDL